MVYLLHFSLPYPRDKRGWTQHYIGFTEFPVDLRVAHHMAGRGSKFMRAVAESGRQVVVARKWKRADRNFERRLKNRKKAHLLCPICCDDALRRGRGSV